MIFLPFALLNCTFDAELVFSGFHFLGAAAQGEIILNMIVCKFVFLLLLLLDDVCDVVGFD